MKKIIFALIAVGILAVGGFATAQNSGWIGTGWITSGSVIQSAPLKSNLDWLQENKVHKPQDCANSLERLTWRDGGWGCHTMQACTLGSTRVAHGGTTRAYSTSSVPAGETCVSQVRTCDDGVLTGTYAFTSCVPDNPPATCDFNGTVVTHGGSVPAYQVGSVAHGETCVEQNRTCNDGTLSGSYTFSSCTVGAPGTCAFNGLDIAHTHGVMAYQNSSVQYGDSCVSETRTCDNGTLSGSYGFNACSVGVPEVCLFNGADVVAHGAGITAYQTTSVESPASCVSETRTCDNGSLSGSYVNTSCTVTTPPETPPAATPECGSAAFACSPGESRGGTSGQGDGYVYWSCKSGSQEVGCSIYSPSDR